MQNRPAGSDNPSLSVEIPYYGWLALSILPSFLEVIGPPERTVFRHPREIEFDPARDGGWPDPPQGVTRFFFSPGYGYDRNIRSIVITVKYRPGEEGTRGSIDKIHAIELFSGGMHKLFYYLEHHCLCKHCRGIKYPFLPVSLSRGEFEEMSEEEQLDAIRKYLKET